MAKNDKGLAELAIRLLAVVIVLIVCGTEGAQIVGSVI